MFFDIRPTKDLIEIASAGGGFVIKAGTRSTADLVLIASAAARGGGIVTFRGMDLRDAQDLIEIATASKGHVIFEA